MGSAAGTGNSLAADLERLDPHQASWDFGPDRTATSSSVMSSGPRREKEELKFEFFYQGFRKKVA
jgi:hypothetical protein